MSSFESEGLVWVHFTSSRHGEAFCVAKSLIINIFLFFAYIIHKIIWGRLLVQTVSLECQFFHRATSIGPLQSWGRTEYEDLTSCHYIWENLLPYNDCGRRSWQHFIHTRAWNTAKLMGVKFMKLTDYGIQAVLRPNNTFGHTWESNLKSLDQQSHTLTAWPILFNIISCILYNVIAENMKLKYL